MIRHELIIFSDRRTNKLPVKAIQEICSFVLLSSESIQDYLASSPTERAGEGHQSWLVMNNQ